MRIAPKSKRWSPVALGIVTFCAASSTTAQLAPTGDHYAARASDTGFMGVVNGSGGYSTSVPLDLPPARGGLPIPLSVVYGARGVGAAGLGWDVPLSYVRVDTSFAHRRPALDKTGTMSLPFARTQVSVSLAGQVMELVPRGNAWVGRTGGLALTLTQQGGNWVMYDGDGLTYRFVQSSTLSGTGLWLLSSITGAGGASLTLTYAIGTPSLAGGTALSIDISTISYNSHPSTTCPKHLVQLLYSAPSTAPLAMSMIGTRVLARMRTLGNIYVRVTPTCGTNSVLLHNYAFTYTPDADTGLPRLASVTVSARGDGSDHSVLPVASYGYGSATSRDFTTAPPQRVLAYQPAETIPFPDGAANSNLASTFWNGVSPPPGISGYQLNTGQILTDVTGDGRPDLVFTAQDGSGTLWVAPNVAGGGGSRSTFGSAFQLQDATFSSGPFEMATASNIHRYQVSLDKPYQTERVWRMAIDVNGDGRLDILDAAEQAGAWVAYLNTPGTDPSHPVWVRRTIDLTDVRARLQALIPGQGDDLANHIPLANRKTAPAHKAWLSCSVWNGFRWVPVPDGWSNGCSNPNPNDPVHEDHWTVDAREELTFTEWEVRDVNGDGYPDLVFNRSEADSVATNPPDWKPGDNPNLHVIVTPVDFGIFGPSEVDVLLDVAGVRIDDGTSIFSVAVTLSDDPSHCGVGEWVSRDVEQSQEMSCGLADVNGDGLVDRVEGTTARLGTGTYPAAGMDVSTFTLTLPGALSVQKNPTHDWPDGCNDPSSNFDPFHQAALRDVTGDGVPDYVASGDDRVGPWTVAIGTGTGFLAPIPIKDGFTLSHELEPCDGGWSLTRDGLYDFDGDGKPEPVTVYKGNIYVDQLVGDAGTPGAPEAGKLVTIYNGYGAVTQIDYRSAKEDTSAPHEVPFPEIVVSRVQTTGSRGLGGSLAATSYAYGKPIWIFDPIRDGFRMAAYGRTIELRVAPFGSVAGPQTVATITDALPLPDWKLTLTPDERFARYLRAGQVSDVTVFAAGIGDDPWALLPIDVTSDSRRIGATHYETRARLFNEASTGSFDCLDIMFPYDWRTSFTYNLGPQWAFDSCTSHGLEYTWLVTTWRGSAGPPSDANVQTSTNLANSNGVDAIDDFGRPTRVVYRNDFHRADDDVCVDISYPTPVGTGARVLSAPWQHKVSDCDNGTTYAFDYSEYDGLPGGSIAAGLLTSRTVERHAADSGARLDTIRQFDVAYDAAANPSVITRQREDGAIQTSKLQYDPFGLVVAHAHTDATGVPSTDVFTTMDPISLDTTSVQDENGSQHGMRYDGFGRPTMLTVTPSTTGLIGALATFGYVNFAAGNTSGRYVTQTTFTDPVPLANVGATVGRTSTTYLDELGRERYTLVSLGADYTDSVVEGLRSYDTFGRVLFEADPYPLSQDPASAYGTTHYYSADGSPALSIRGNGMQPFTTVPDPASERFPTFFRHSFSGFVESFSVEDADALTPGSPQAGVIRDTLTSAVGRLLFRSTWQNGVRIEHAAFGTDHLGQLANMTRFLDAADQTGPTATSWSRDSLGQLLSLQEPGLPLQTRSYSKFGELLSVQRTPAPTEPSHAIVNRYDALGRLVHTEDQNGGVADADTMRDFFYDSTAAVSPQVTPTNLLGRLAHATSPTGDVYLSYDGFGNVNARTFTDESAAFYVEKHSYHGDGSLAALEVDLPDNGYRPEQVSYGYDSAGRLRSASYSDGTITEPMYLSQARDALGRLRAATFGKATYGAAYADVGRKLLQSVNVSSPLGSRQIVYNSYDPVGRELSRTEGTGATFTRPTTTSAYDGLGRLVSSIKQSGQGTLASRSFSYDGLGNASGLGDNVGNLGALVTMGAPDLDRMCFVHYGRGAPPPAGPGCNVAYDSAGNVASQPTRTGTRTLTYYNSGDARTIVDTAGARATFRYGALGGLQELDVTGASSDTRHDRSYGALIARHDQTSGGATTQVISRQFPAGGMGAIRRGPNGSWVFQFAEGRGTRFTFDENGAILQDVDYQPFGEAASSGAAPGAAQYSSEQWNGGDALAALGVVNVGARVYDPVVGRFLSRDPLLIPRTAATTNAYAFAMNDPVNASDPSGLDSDPCYGNGLCISMWGSSGDTSAAIGGLVSAALGLGSLIAAELGANAGRNAFEHFKASYTSAVNYEQLDTELRNERVQEFMDRWRRGPSIGDIVMAPIHLGRDIVMAPIHAVRNFWQATKEVGVSVGSRARYYAFTAKDGLLPSGLAKRWAWSGVSVAINAAMVVSPLGELGEGLLAEEVVADEVDAAFASGQVESGTMVEFSDANGALTGSGPRLGEGDIWYHDNVKVPGAGPAGETVNLRTHSPNPTAPAGSYSRSNYTTQINTKDGRYLLPDGSWKRLQDMTAAEKAAAHYPAGN